MDRDVNSQYLHANNSVDDCHSSVERKLGDLGSGELAICIAELNHRVIVLIGVGVGANTVETGLFDRVLDRFRVVEMNRLGKDGVFGDISGVFGENECPDILLRAESCIDASLFANSVLCLSSIR